MGTRADDDDGWEDWEDEEESTRVYSIEEIKAVAPSIDDGLVPMFIAIAGRSAGRVFRIDQRETFVGRMVDLAVAVMDDGVSRRHARLILGRDDKVTLHDLRSTNGTYLNDVRVKDPVVLEEGDCVRFGNTCVLRFGYKNVLEEQAQEQLYDAATRDPLTNAYNRRYFDECISSEWSWAVRRGQVCAVVSFDLDHFKLVNDTFGHPAGDYVLSEVGKLVLATIRREDTFARVGGEEFLVLARGTDKVAAMIVAGRIREAIERHDYIHQGRRIRVTASLGVCTSQDEGVSSPSALLAMADESLYRAKQAGRNRVVG